MICEQTDIGQLSFLPGPALAAPNLREYDWIVFSNSSGKDSQTILDVGYHQAKEEGMLHRCVVVHCDLGRVEWKGCKDLARRQAEHYGFRFEVVKKEVDLLEQVEKRGMWPDSARRYCTSDQKRAQVYKLFTKLAAETRAARWRQDRVKILNVMGMRAEESRSRAKLVPFGNNTMASNGLRRVDDWLPIHAWKLAQVWERIRQSGVPHHEAYDLGMPRLSCCFCIFAPRAALMLAGKHNPELLNTYVELEQRIGHRFKKDLAIKEIQDALAVGEDTGDVQDWAM